MEEGERRNEEEGPNVNCSRHTFLGRMVGTSNGVDVLSEEPKLLV